jgi:dTDP-4-amino-4,6-dideoxygalactose transaminase
MMVSRLGVWPPLSLGVYAWPAADRIPFPLNEPGCALFERGRHALWHGLRALHLGAGDEVLVPAYHHGSEIEALIRAGLTCRFYEGTEALAPHEPELQALLGPRTRALYLIHYLGFAQDAPRWRRWCKERGIFLIEDAAQAFLASVDGLPLGSFGDVAIFCLYKTFGLPDGGALLSSASPAAAAGSSPNGIGRMARRHLAWGLERSPLLAELASRFERSARYSAEQDFALGDPNAPPSAATLRLLRRMDPGAAARRRANYRRLLDEFGDLVPAPFATLPDGASPFAFPMASEDKSTLLARLAIRGVRGLDFWSVPHPALPAAGFAGAAARRARTVCLPVHQELRHTDVERIARAVRSSRGPALALQLEPLTALDTVRDE